MAARSTEREPIRVVHVITPERDGIGGADLHVADLAAAQMMTGRVHSSVLETCNADYAHRYVLARGIPAVRTLDGSPIVSLIRALRTVAHAGNVDLLHSHGYNANYWTMVAKIAFRRGLNRVPVVATSHGWLENDRMMRAMTAADLWCLRRADAIILCAEHQRRTIESRLGQDAVTKSVVIRNGIHAPRPPASSSPKRLTGSPVVLGVGRLAVDKRFDLFVRAAAQALNTLPTARFYIAGDGTQRERLQRLICELGLSEHVQLLGLVHDMPALYAAADILLHTSEHETTSRVILEAAASELVTVAPAIEGLCGVVSAATAVVVPGSSPYDYAAAVVRAHRMKSTERRTMTAMARQRVHADFNIVDKAEAVEAVYERVLSRP